MKLHDQGVKQSHVEIGTSMEHTNRREPFGDRATESAIGGDDVGIHESLEKRQP